MSKSKAKGKAEKPLVLMNKAHLIYYFITLQEIQN
jgi:hypothetical protein